MAKTRRRRSFASALRSAIVVLAFLSVGIASGLGNGMASSSLSSSNRQAAGSVVTEKQSAAAATAEDERGHALKSELWKLYNELKTARKLGPVSTDITERVLPYVAPGISFQEAETILRAAGFKMPPYPKPQRASDPNRPRDWYAVVAWISPFAESFPFKVSVSVTLQPKSPGDYTSVEKVGAHFFVSGP